MIASEFHIIHITFKHTSMSLIPTFTWTLSMSINILVVFINSRPRMRCIFELASTSNNMKSTWNGNLLVLIITSLIVPTGFLQVLYVIYSVAEIGSMSWSPILFTIDNGILFILAPMSTCAFPTSILPIVAGNITTLVSYFFRGRVCLMILQFSSCDSSFYGPSFVSSSMNSTIMLWLSLTTL